MQYQQVGSFSVFSWSVAGNETCVGVHAGQMRFAFDMGFAPHPLISCDHVFISHGHADHVGAIPQHMKKRRLNHLPNAVYYMHPCLIGHVRTVCKAFAAMSELDETGQTEYDCTLVPILPESRIKLGETGWSVEAIATHHTVQSQGYVLFSRDPSGDEDYPEIAYLGDSRFSVLKNARSAFPPLLCVRLLIMEATFLDRPERLMERACIHGHTHLDELRQNSSLFKHVGNVYLIHFSARYTTEQIERLTHMGMPSWLAGRIVPSLCAQKCLALGW
ncbi:hypothetical protein P879_06735 [Paragonimus westermani]|uniref:Metallo-beta-lactamase domain-containing protein n=1 Tax=Paragonimus westermani TaxID=34504 RepID=A0A8T0DLZ3_9TREM|nr:hypothetical protein P879_06735 [Paragonimus westermani]